MKRMEIWQANRKLPGGQACAFQSFSSCKRRGIDISLSNYNLVYSEPVTEEMDLDKVFYRFNEQRPATFKGHSLSVSDILIFRDETTESYYVDDFGFEKLDDSFGQQNQIPSEFQKRYWFSVDEQVVCLGFYDEDGSCKGEEFSVSLKDGRFLELRVPTGAEKTLLSMMDAVEALSVVQQQSLEGRDAMLHFVELLEAYGYEELFLDEGIGASFMFIFMGEPTMTRQKRFLANGRNLEEAKEDLANSYGFDVYAEMKNQGMKEVCIKKTKGTYREYHEEL